MTFEAAMPPAHLGQHAQSRILAEIRGKIAPESRSRENRTSSRSVGYLDTETHAARWLLVSPLEQRLYGIAIRVPDEAASFLGAVKHDEGALRLRTKGTNEGLLRVEVDLEKQEVAEFRRFNQLIQHGPLHGACRAPTRRDIDQNRLSPALGGCECIGCKWGKGSLRRGPGGIAMVIPGGRPETVP